MSRFALVAMLLLVVLPTVGRVAGNRDASMPSMSMSMSMPTSHAMHASDAGANCPVAPTAPRPVPMPHHGDGDCDYCPLLAALATPSPLAPPAMTVTAPRHVPPAVIDAVVDVRHPAGLGSRGPPVAA